MINQFKQMAVITRVNLCSIPRRLAISVSMGVSVALAVAVLSGFLAMAKGFEKALTGAASQSVAIVLGGGTNQELDSEISPDVVRNLAAMGSKNGVARDKAGALMISREIVVPVEISDPGSKMRTTLTLRGMDQNGLSIRDGVRLSAGRLFRPGTRELVVGERLAKDYPVFKLGARVRLGVVDWQVVGYFSANGSAFESEIWGDLDAVRAGFDRQGQIQSLRVRLATPQSLPMLAAALGRISSTPLLAISEVDFYAAQTSGTVKLIRYFGWPLALLMAIGATAGALNTMMNSVSDRMVEIVTVRALGFSRASAFFATWLEAVALAALGAAVGILASWLVFNGWQASTMGANNASMGFDLAVTPEVMVTAAMFGLAIGVIGGALPALVAMRLPLHRALRAQ